MCVGFLGEALNITAISGQHLKQTERKEFCNESVELPIVLASHVRMWEVFSSSKVRLATSANHECDLQSCFQFDTLVVYSPEITSQLAGLR